MAVPLYLPVTIADGKVQGIVRLKHVAAAAGLGSLGRNTVLFNPRFGPRLLLSGVVSGGRARNPGSSEGVPVAPEIWPAKNAGAASTCAPGGIGGKRCRCVSVPDDKCLGTSLS